MTIIGKMLRATVCVVTGLALMGSVVAKEINLGVQAPRGALKALKVWAEVGKYIQAETGVTVKLVPLNPAKTIAAVKAGKVDFLLSNPVLSLVAIEKHKFMPLVTRVKKFGPHFAGVIFTSKKSGIKNADDIKGKNVMAFKFKKSAAAYVFQVKHLKDKGIDAHKDFKTFRQAKKQDDIVYAVSRGIVDVGFVKTGMLESMSREGKVKLDEFHIIDQVKDDFKQVHSTKLYPQWTVTVNPGYDAAVVAKVKAALLKLKPEHLAAKKAKIKGFVAAVSLDGLKETLKSLNLPPYNK